MIFADKAPAGAFSGHLTPHRIVDSSRISPEAQVRTQVVHHGADLVGQLAARGHDHAVRSVQLRRLLHVLQVEELVQHRDQERQRLPVPGLGGDEGVGARVLQHPRDGLVLDVRRLSEPAFGQSLYQPRIQTEGFVSLKSGMGIVKIRGCQRLKGVYCEVVTNRFSVVPASTY